VTFSALIVSGLNYSRLLTTVLGIPTGVIATIWQLVLSLPTSRLKNRRCIIIALGNIIPIISAILLWQIPDENRHGRLAAYYVFYTYWGQYVMSTTLPMANTSGHTKKVTMNAVFFLAYCLGNIIGPQIFQGSDAPNYPKGYIGLLASLIIASVSICLYGILCSLENIRRAKERGIEELPEVTDPFSDLTDNQKASFRYTY
jgi:Na+/melibiose symporter-like transporter